MLDQERGLPRLWVHRSLSQVKSWTRGRTGACAESLAGSLWWRTCCRSGTDIQQEDVFLRNDWHLAKFKEHHRRQISFLAIWNETTHQADMYAMQAYMQLNSYHLPLQVPMKTLFTAIFKKIISFSIRYECVYRAFIRAIRTQQHSLHLVLRQSASSLPIYLI